MKPVILNQREKSLMLLYNRKTLSPSELASALGTSAATAGVILNDSKKDDLMEREAYGRWRLTAKGIKEAEKLLAEKVAGVSRDALFPNFFPNTTAKEIHSTSVISRSPPGQGVPQELRLLDQIRALVEAHGEKKFQETYDLYMRIKKSP